MPRLRFFPAVDRTGVAVGTGVALGLPRCGAQAIAYVLFARGLRSMGAGDAATLTLGEPLTATALGVVAAVADALGDRTLSGDPPPGGRLREIELAREHGAARHSVRALAAERLVTIERGGRRRRRAAVNGSHGL